MKPLFVYATATALLASASFASAATVDKRLSSLESRMAKIEARMNKAEGKLTTAQLAGTYASTSMVRVDGMDGIDGWIHRGTLTLDADGTFVWEIVEEGIVYIVGEQPTHDTSNYTGENADTGTWTWANGELTLDIDGGGDTTQHIFRHAAGGRLFTNIDTYYIDMDANSEQWVQLLMRIN